jgi:hypothetical protein
VGWCRSLEVKERGGGWSWSSGTVSESMTERRSHGHCVAGLSLEVGWGGEGVGGGVVGSSSLSAERDGRAIVVVGG